MPARAYSLEILWENLFSTIVTIILVACFVILIVLVRRIQWMLREVNDERALTEQAGLVYLQDDGPVRPQVDRHPARLHP